MYQKRWGMFAGLVLSIIAIFAMFILPEALVVGGYVLATIPVWGSIKENTFKELSSEEVKKLSTEELAAYTADRTEFQVKALILDSKKDMVSEEDVEKRVKKLNEDIKKLTSEQIDKLNKSVEKLLADNKVSEEALKDIGAELKELKEKGTKTKGESKRVSFRKALENAFMEKKDVILKEKDDDYGKRFSLKDYFDSHEGTPTLTLKAVDMLESNIVQAEVANIRLTDLDPNRVGTPLAIYQHAFDWIPSRNITRPYMSILVVYDYQDGAGTKTEGSAPNKSSFLLKTVQFPSFVIGTYGTLSDETMDDLPEVMDEIALVFPSKIKDNVDGQLLGTSGDDSSALGGLFSNSVSPVKHTDFDTTTYENTVESGGNMVDLIGTMMLQVETAKYRPNVVIMNPADIKKLTEQRDANDNSISDRRVKYDVTGRASMVSGLRIIPSTSITADTMAVLDLSQLVIGKRRDMTMKIGFNGTDLTEGQQTVVINVRLAFSVRDAVAVCYSDSIAADIVIIVSAGA